MGSGLRDAAEPVRVAALTALLPLGQMVAGAGAQDIETFHGLVNETLQVRSDAIYANVIRASSNASQSQLLEQSTAAAKPWAGVPLAVLPCL